MKVEVTQEHIDKGQRREHDKCPIALAVEDIGYKSVSVDGKSLDAWKDKVDGVKGYIYGDLPDEAVEFIRTFDRGDKVEPLTFEFEMKEAPPF